MTIRLWRIDGREDHPLGEVTTNREHSLPYQRRNGEFPDDSGGEPVAEGSGLRHWWSAAMRWSRAAWTGGFGGGRARFEESLLRFARELEGAGSASDVEAGLLGLSRKLVRDKRIALIRAGEEVDHRASCGPDGDDSTEPTARSTDGRGKLRGEMVTEFPLRCGGTVHGRLQIFNTWGWPYLRPAALRRLAIACTMAAGALENVRQHSEWGWKVGEETGDDGRSRCGDSRPSGVIRDATFLNAVFPFALGQARRHREPVSLLCLAIDRLNAIQDLLGPDVVDRLVQEVSQVIADSIRSSDIVARLDDNRIIVLLIRARARNALYVAEKISQAVAEKTQDAAELGCATVSIGVAEFPGDARSASCLLEAADNALSRAQREGNGQIAVAASTPIECAVSQDAVSSAATPY